MNILIETLTNKVISVTDEVPLFDVVWKTANEIFGYLNTENSARVELLGDRDITIGDTVTVLGTITKAGYVPHPAPVPTVQEVDPTEWLIDLGPFYDRFGNAKMAVLTSADAGVKAIMADVSIRKWIDLKRSDVTTSLAYIGSKVSAVDTALQESILNTPVTVEENRALKKLYF